LCHLQLLQGMRFLYPVVRLVVRVDYQRVFQTIVDNHRVLDRMNIGWQLVAFPVLNFDLVRQNLFEIEFLAGWNTPFSEHVHPFFQHLVSEIEGERRQIGYESCTN
jgi:hypothetical protein